MPISCEIILLFVVIGVLMEKNDKILIRTGISSSSKRICTRYQRGHRVFAPRYEMKNNLSAQARIDWCVPDKFKSCLGERCSTIGIFVIIDSSMKFPFRCVSISSIVSGLGIIAGEGRTTTGTSAVLFPTPGKLAGGMKGIVSFPQIYSRFGLVIIDILFNHMLL